MENTNVIVQEMQAIELLEKIKNTSGSKEKAKLIASGKYNGEFLFILKFLNDINITTGLAMKKIRKPVQINIDMRRSIPTLGLAISYLSNNPTGKDAQIAYIQQYLKDYSGRDREVREEILTKTYKCGVTAKTINSALGYDLIKLFSCQLAHSYEKYEDKIKDKPVYVTRKMDGFRLITKIYGSEDKVTVEFYTRVGLRVTQLDQVENDILQLIDILTEQTDCTFNDLFPHGLVLDGEAVAFGGTDVYKRTSKIMSTVGKKEGISYKIFDTLTVSEFDSGSSQSVYHARRKDLDVFAEVIQDHSLKYIDVLPVLYYGSNQHEIDKILKREIANGEEGVMLNLANGKYVTTRTSNLLKMKEFFNADVLVKSVYEGTGKYKGKLGGVIVHFKNEEYDFEVGLGSGFDDTERELYWQHPEMIIGKIVDVRYFEISSNKNEGFSLRFPTYKGIRHDKSIDDINIEGGANK